MASIGKAETRTQSENLHAVPLTLEGSSVLHQMFHFRWAEWRKVAPAQQHEILAEAGAALVKLEQHVNGQSALFSMLGHKADLMLIHFRNTFDHLKHVELEIARLRLNDYLEQTTSYVSVVELGLYESSLKLYRTLQEKGIAPHSPEWDAAIDETVGAADGSDAAAFVSADSAFALCLLLSHGPASWRRQELVQPAD